MSDPPGKQTLAAIEARAAADLVDMKRLHDASARLLRETDLESLLREILVAAIAIMRADMGNMQMFDPDSGSLRIRTQIGFEREFVEFFDHICEGEAACGAAWKRGERVVVSDVEASPLFAGRPSLGVMLRAGARAVQSTPLISRSGRLLGMISTHYHQPHEPGDRELRLLDLLARQVADLVERAESEEALRRSQRELQRATAGLEREVARRTRELRRQTVRLRRLAAELTQAEQRERNHLAGLIHDHLQQLLVAVRMRLATVRRHVGDPAVERDLDEIQELAGQALRAAGSITAELQPRILYVQGLVPGLEWLGEHVREKYGLSLEVEGGELAEIAESTRVLLFECVREAVFNIVEHAGVDFAVIRVNRAGEFVEVTVADDGCGFDLARLEEIEHENCVRFGLFSIGERLAAVGGEFEIDTATGDGTRLTMRAPFEPTPERVDATGSGSGGESIGSGAGDWT